jgi:hypothetical protein
MQSHSNFARLRDSPDAAQRSYNDEYEAMEAVMAPLWRIPSPQLCGRYQHSAFKWFERKRRGGGRY